jgi:hypothetical protein
VSIAVSNSAEFARPRRGLSLQKRAPSLLRRDMHHAVGHDDQSAGGGDAPLGKPPALGRQRMGADLSFLD